MVNQTPDIRTVMLTVINEIYTKDATSGSLQSGSVLSECARRLNARQNIELEQALLSQFQDLFRTGYLAWGLNLSNTDPPFFHVSARGRALLARLTRDPANPGGYRAHLYTVASLNDVARSYADEAVDCYASGFYKASAVLVGGAAESLVLEFRDTLVTKLNSLSKKPPKDIEDWRIKRVLEALHATVINYKGIMPRDLFEEFEAYWSAFSQQIRTVRNEVGHPSNVTPVSEDTVHASLLIFPELAKLQNRLLRWVTNGLV
jgi:hypothetical protein